ncbi:hypothetical protein L484_011224 [Morus notabilis]|uniref:Uncharacterized protein n=1 Tax=Morus notabilis TaxID=981085 RepID=W9SAT9_9ROSA|nr:hypothetical protein L484_011224 [Morus notabilis]
MAEEGPAKLPQFITINTLIHGGFINYIGEYQCEIWQDWAESTQFVCDVLGFAQQRPVRSRFRATKAGWGWVSCDGDQRGLVSWDER